MSNYRKRQKHGIISIRVDIDFNTDFNDSPVSHEQVQQFLDSWLPDPEYDPLDLPRPSISKYKWEPTHVTPLKDDTALR